MFTISNLSEYYDRGDDEALLDHEGTILHPWRTPVFVENHSQTLPSEYIALIAFS